jgi:spermidine synthase
VGVLGAGGCVVPAFLHTILPASSTVDCVELSPDVLEAARACFGIAELEEESSKSLFRLHGGCALEWLASQSENSLDVVIVDIEGGDEEGSSLVAPPSRWLSSSGGTGTLFSSLDRVLSNPGVFVLNCIGDAQGHDEVLQKMPSGYALATCLAPGSESGRQRLLFGARGGDGDLLLLERDVRNALGCLPALLDDKESWLKGWQHVG